MSKFQILLEQNIDSIKLETYKNGYSDLVKKYYNGTEQYILKNIPSHEAIKLFVSLNFQLQDFKKQNKNQIQRTF